jgi:uncharacterized membrane protein YqaE (UPF0057 family)
VVVNRRFWTLLMPNVVVVNGRGHYNNVFAVVGNGGTGGIMQCLVFGVLFTPNNFYARKKFREYFDAPNSKSKIFAKFRPLSREVYENFKPTTHRYTVDCHRCWLRPEIAPQPPQKTLINALLTLFRWWCGQLRTLLMSTRWW